jgi:hypothetical protein
MDGRMTGVWPAPGHSRPLPGRSAHTASATSQGRPGARPCPGPRPLLLKSICRWPPKPREAKSSHPHGDLGLCRPRTERGKAECGRGLGVRVALARTARLWRVTAVGAGWPVACAPAHLVGQCVSLPGRHLPLIVRVPKHAAQSGGVLQTEKGRCGHSRGSAGLRVARLAGTQAPGGCTRVQRSSFRHSFQGGGHLLPRPPKPSPPSLFSEPQGWGPHFRCEKCGGREAWAAPEQGL